MLAHCVICQGFSDDTKENITTSILLLLNKEGLIAVDDIGKELIQNIAPKIISETTEAWRKKDPKVPVMGRYREKNGGGA